MISQLEDIKKYKDGSLRSVKLVIEPFVSSHKFLKLKLIENDKDENKKINISSKHLLRLRFCRFPVDYGSLKFSF